jgi:hypothetical protein
VPRSRSDRKFCGYPGRQAALTERQETRERFWNRSGAIISETISSAKPKLVLYIFPRHDQPAGAAWR